MNTDFTYYIYVLIAIIVGIVVIKKAASCLFRTVFTIALRVVLGVIYFYFFRG